MSRGKRGDEVKGRGKGKGEGKKGVVAPPRDLFARRS